MWSSPPGAGAAFLRLCVGFVVAAVSNGVISTSEYIARSSSLPISDLLALCLPLLFDRAAGTNSSPDPSELSLVAIRPTKRTVGDRAGRLGSG